MAEVSTEEHLRTSDHNPIHFRSIVEHGRTDPQVNVLNWCKANFNDIRQELAKIYWKRLLAGEGMLTSGGF